MISSVSGGASILAIVIGGFAQLAAAQGAGSRADTRLVLQLTVDGLRGDLLHRYRANLGKGGFRLLMDRGLVYTDAHYLHANTETIVGHATLATGAHPAQHGMVGNVWYDREAGQLAYNIEDAEHPLLATRESTRQGAQVDPAQKRSRTKGRSPVSLLVPTIADTLVAYTSGKSKVFGVSGKDRSAVAMAGKVGKAFWLSTDTGDFVTSRYYYETYPDWAVRWNARGEGAEYAGSAWELLLERSAYRHGEQDDRPFEADLKGYGRTFPHPFPAADDPLFPTKLIVSPIGDKLTADFAKTLMAAEEVGQDDTPDYVSISFSGVDAVNHFFGPGSLENEDVVIQLDRTLADLLAWVDERVGLHRTLVVLSADHGIPEMPEQMKRLGYAAGRLYGRQVHEMANAAGKRLFGIDGLIRYTFRPYLYVDRDAAQRAGLDERDVADGIADALTHVPGISTAASRRQIEAARDDPLLMRIRRNHHASRSGDIYVAPEPYWFFSEKGAVIGMHGSPWRYDTHVPIILAGPGIASARVHRRVHPVDVAPTIAAFLGVSPPAGAVGAPLVEALR